MIVAGGIMAWRSGAERSRRQREFNRLSRRTGDLPISDPTRVHVRALETHEPLHFAWRIYLPANYPVVLKGNSGSTTSSAQSAAMEFIARVRIREDSAGNLQVYTHFANSSSRGDLGDPALVKFLRGRLEKIVVEQLGAADIVAVDSDQAAVLLRLALPEDLQSEARGALSVDTQKLAIPVLYEWKLGPDPPKKR
jgi:hypothetical protein